jgi:nitrogen-specific signal transduction histidine kinase
MKDECLLGPWVRRFLLEHLVTERNLSRNTQASYRDTLSLLLPFASRQGSGAIDRMTVEDLTPAIMKNLFLPFRRGEGNKQGLGLGLFIASETARAHGGDLNVVSSEHETRFTFEMPLTGSHNTQGTSDRLTS